ncbi:(p)ppGpp synthetase [Spirochaetia bacterium]|nr:(p)ppGpp synthetase [Spirochaetia bacterium]
MSENSHFPDQTRLREEYDKYADVRFAIAKDIETQLEQALRNVPSRISIKARSKDFYSYYKKQLRFLRQAGGGAAAAITDLIGIRVVCPFIEDLPQVEAMIQETFEVIEVERKGSNQTFKEFGYQSTHFLVKIPTEITENRGYAGCDVAEIQIRTILQDAWAEVEHELVYKAEFTPFDEPLKRKLAAVNASLSLADIIFQEIKTYQRQLYGELAKRRDSFYKKIEEATDAQLVADALSCVEPPAGTPTDGTSTDGTSTDGTSTEPDLDTFGTSIDDLLLSALSAHNKNRFSEATALYSRILEMNPNNTIIALIYKHRGMAHFAQSQYGDAIDDFTLALEFDPDSYKAAYYRGIVRVVLQQYQGAIDDFTFSLKLHPYQSFCMFRRAQAYYHIGDLPQALADCEAALVLWPGSPSAETIKKFRSMLHAELKM